jgi:hypothetical protein
MPTQIYAASGTFPLKIRESLSTRFSGLLEYSATYLIEKGASSLGFSVGQSIVTSSGTVKIFPAPRVSRSNENAFDEVEVTAYGQGISLNSRVVMGTEVLELSLSKNETDNSQDPPIQYNWTIYERWRCETATKHSVNDNSSSNYSTPSGTLDKDMERRWVVGTPINGGQSSLSIDWNDGIRDIQRTNYGAYDEVAVMKGYIPQVS